MRTRKLAALMLALMLLATGMSFAAAAEEQVVHKLKLMGPINYKGYQSWEDRFDFPAWNAWEALLLEKGISLEYERIMSDQYAVVLQTRFASQKDMPDIINITALDDATALGLAKNGFIIDINSAIEQYSDGTIAERGAEWWPFDGQSSTAPDGNRYWFTSLNNLMYKKPDGTKVDCPVVLGNAIRADWLEKLDLPMPTTLEEYKDALIAFRDNDMNGNGVADEVLMYDPYSYNFYSGIAQWFGLPPALLTVPIGVAINGDETEVRCAWYEPGIKAYFEFLNELVEAEVFDLTLVGASEELCNQRIAENKVAALRSYALSLPFEEMISTDKDAEYLYMIVPPIQAVEGVEPYSFQESPHLAWQKFAITSACEDVEGAIKLIELLYSEDGSRVYANGVEGIDFKDADDPEDLTTGYYLAADGQFRHHNEKAEYPAMTQEEQYANRVMFPAKSWIGTLLPQITGGYTTFTSVVPRSMRKEAQQIELMQYERFFPTNSNPYYAIATAEEQDTLSKYSAAVTTASEELAMKLIIGDISLDDWDEHIKTLQDYGLDEVLAVYEARHERWKQGGN